MRYWREVTSRSEFYGSDYWQGEKAQAWGGGDYLDGAPQQTLTKLVQKHLLPAGGRILEVGAAFGFLLRNLRQAGYAAFGIDASPYCVKHADQVARPFMQYASILNLPFHDDAFDLVICMEVLEHLPPELVMTGIAELRRVSRGPVLASVPSYGPNDYGPYGLPYHTYPENPTWWRDAVAHLPFADLDIDEKNGEPRCGHLTHATYRWWSERFLEQGLARVASTERKLYTDSSLDLSPWQLYYLVPATEVAEIEPCNHAGECGWGDTVQLDDKQLRWCKSGGVEIELEPYVGAGIELEIFTGPRRLTHPYELYWQIGAAEGKFIMTPGEIVRVQLPVPAESTKGKLDLSGGPCWTEQNLFKDPALSAKKNGGWGVVQINDCAVTSASCEKVKESDWAPVPNTIQSRSGLGGFFRRLFN